MAIIATAGEAGNFTPAPEGVHQAVCADVVDLGMIPGFGGKVQHKVCIVWQIDELRDDKQRFLLFKRYTLSLNEKANLRKDLEAWRGRAFTREEEMGFDVEKLIGANCMANVQHRASKDGKTYANVVSLMPLPKAMKDAKLSVLDYKRPENFGASQKAAAVGDESEPPAEPAHSPDCRCEVCDPLPF